MFAPHDQPVQAPLLDRLCGDAAAVTPDLQSWVASIRAEIVRLFSTRSRLGLEAYAAGPLTVIDYGLPDFSGLDTSSRRDLDRLRGALRHAVEQFEPRLLLDGLEVQACGSNHLRGLVRIQARTRFDGSLRPARIECPADLAAGSA